MSAITRVRRPRFSALPLRPPRPRIVLAVALAVMLLGAGWLWLRGSFLVSVDRVTVTGLQGPSAGEIRSALQSAARNMTTLDVSMSALRVAVAPFPVVKGLSVSTQFPHGMRIHVFEQISVAAVTVGGRKIAVAADGTLLPSVSASGLPSIPVSVAPGGARLSAGSARNEVALLAAAPAWLRARVTQAETMTAHGLVADMRAGPQIYFGGASQLRAKWTAAAVVLADPSSHGAAYIDVSVPRLPAAGGAPGAATSGQSTTPSAAPTTPTTTGATGTSGAAGAGTTATTPTATGATGATGSTGAAIPAATGTSGG